MGLETLTVLYHYRILEEKNWSRDLGRLVITEHDDDEDGGVSLEQEHLQDAEVPTLQLRWKEEDIEHQSALHHI